MDDYTLFSRRRLVPYGQSYAPDSSGRFEQGAMRIKQMERAQERAIQSAMGLIAQNPNAPTLPPAYANADTPYAYDARAATTLRSTPVPKIKSTLRAENLYKPDPKITNAQPRGELPSWVANKGLTVAPLNIGNESSATLPSFAYARRLDPIEPESPVTRALAAAKGLYRAATSPAATARAVANAVLSGEAAQSTGQPVVQNGVINWGDPDNPSDFFRADQALQELHPYVEQDTVPEPAEEGYADGGIVSGLLNEVVDFVNPGFAGGGEVGGEYDYVEPEMVYDGEYDYVEPETVYEDEYDYVEPETVYDDEYDYVEPEMAEDFDGFAHGGPTLLQDEYPTEYLPEVGRQVMAGGGEVDNPIVDEAYVEPLSGRARMRQTVANIQPRKGEEVRVDGEGWQRALQNYRNFPVRPGEATMRPADLSLRDKIAQAISGDGTSYGSELRKRAANLLVGSRGLPDTGLGIGVADLPIVTGIPLNIADISDAASKGRYGEAALGAALPAAFWARKPIGAALRTARDVITSPVGRGAAGATSAAVMSPDDAEAANILKALSTAKQLFKGSDVIKKDAKAAAEKMSERTPSGDVDFGQALKDYEYSGRKKGDLQPWKEFNPEQAYKEDAILAGILSDRSAAGRKVYAINGVKLSTPVDAKGGGEFQRSLEGPEVWASRPPAVKTMQTRIRKNLEGLKADPENPLFASTILMSKPAIDSTQKMAKAMLRQIEATRGKIDPVAAEALDTFIRKSYPDWPGVLSPVDAERFLAEKEIGARTSSILQAFDKAGAQRGGLPNLGSARFAMMEPRLITADQGASGFAVSRLDPKGVTNKAAHDTYPAGMLGPTQSSADYLGGTKYQVPLEVMFPDWYKTVKPTYVDKRSGLTMKTSPTMIQQTALTQVPLQRATQEWLDNIMKHYEGNPKPWGYAHGGEVDNEIGSPLPEPTFD